MAINKNESVKRVKLDLKGLSPDQKTRAKEVAGEILVEEVNSFLDQSKTPVSKGSFRRNKNDGSASSLFEFGDLRIAIEGRAEDTDHVSVGIFNDSSQINKDKALGHNTGFRGHPNESKMRKHRREFIPAPNKVFKRSIMKRVNDSIDSIREENNLTQSLAQEVLDDN